MKRLKGWIICLKPKSSEGYCWQKQKKVDVGLNNSNPLRLLLHEIAHIGINPHGNKHTQEWFDEYLNLMRKYMPGIDISKSDKIIQKTYKLKNRTKPTWCVSCYYKSKKTYCRMGIKQNIKRYCKYKKAKV